MEASVEEYTLTPDLIESASAVISQDTVPVTPYTANRFEQQAQKMWDVFYKHNTCNFFKDRHYLLRECPELAECRIIREVGCGVGNALYPLLRALPTCKVQACDFAATAVHLVRQHSEFTEERVDVCVADLTKEPLQFSEPADCVLLLFVLSAIDPSLHAQAISNALAGLKPGGFVLFRDYGRYDEGQLRLARKGGKLIKKNFYLKQDGTRVYYFSLDETRALFANYEEIENTYHLKRKTNRKEGLEMNRVWVQAKFVKPADNR